MDWVKFRLDVGLVLYVINHYGTLFLREKKAEMGFVLLISYSTNALMYPGQLIPQPGFWWAAEGKIAPAVYVA